MTTQLGHARKAVERLVADQEPRGPTVAAARCELVRCGLRPVEDVRPLLVRLGFEADDGAAAVVRRSAVGRRPGCNRLETLRGVTNAVEAAEDRPRFAAALRLIVQAPDAAGLRGEFCNDVRLECRRAGLCLKSDRVPVVRLLTRLLEKHGLEGGRCDVCGQDGPVVCLDQNVCAGLLASKGRAPCFTQPPKRPFASLDDLWADCPTPRPAPGAPARAPRPVDAN
jgi:hypothetical protein